MLTGHFTTALTVDSFEIHTQEPMLTLTQNSIGSHWLNVTFFKIKGKKIFKF